MADVPTRSHQPFAALNRLGNPFVGVLLRSPLHRVVSSQLALITVTGRRSGRRYTFPVAYRQSDDEVTIVVGWPERKRWWRNLREGGEVTLRLRGVQRTGQARVTGDEASGVVVRVRLALDNG
jgi:deazaflavin-dependent oxidoreductase (nitroreductase family)